MDTLSVSHAFSCDQGEVQSSRLGKFFDFLKLEGIVEDKAETYARGERIIVHGRSAVFWSFYKLKKSDLTEKK